MTKDIVVTKDVLAVVRQQAVREGRAEVVAVCDHLKSCWEQCHSIETVATSRLNEIKSCKNIIDQLQKHDGKPGIFDLTCRMLIEKEAVDDITYKGVLLVQTVAYEAQVQNLSFGDTIKVKNSKLMRIMGIESANTLRLGRDLCEKHGWLAFEREIGDRSGTFRIMIP